MKFRQLVTALRNWQQKNRLRAQDLTMLVLSVSLSVLFIEIFLTKANYPYQGCKTISATAEEYLGDFNQMTGWSYKPQISFYQVRRQYEYHFDKFGIRAPSPHHELSAEKPRILFIGDSVTFGEELNYDQTFVAQISQLLGDKFEVVNLGVQGYGTDQSLALMKQLIDQIQPKYVVYTFITDHLNRNLNYDRRLHLKCFVFPGTKPLFSAVNGKLTQIAKPQPTSETDKFKLPLLISRAGQTWREKVAQKNGSGLDLARALVAEIKSEAKRQNATDYYIYYDTQYDLAEDSWNNQVFQQVFSEEQQARTLVLTNWATDSAKKGTKYYVNEDDDIHPNASLSALIAKEFVAKFAQDLAGY